MSYYFSKTIKASFEPTLGRVIEALQDEGFGILTEIDVQETLRNKLDVDFQKYIILGACNPPFAYEALQAENKIGTMRLVTLSYRKLSRVRPRSRPSTRLHLCKRCETLSWQVWRSKFRANYET